jgi:KTSC domain
MILEMIDLSAIKAIAHDGERLQILIQAEGKLAIQSFPAPRQALDGIKQLAAFTVFFGDTSDLEAASTALLGQIARIPVTSSTVKSIGYSDVNRVLQVEFQRGALYRYKDVPTQVFTAFLASESKGTFLNQMIKPFYEYEQVS